MKDKSNNHLEMLDNIIKTLKESGYTKEASKLEYEISASFTSTELCSRSGSILMGFKSRHELKKLIGVEIEDFINFCSKIGLHIQARQ